MKDQIYAVPNIDMSRALPKKKEKKPIKVEKYACAKCKNAHTTLYRHDINGKRLYFCKKHLEEMKRKGE